MLLCTQTPDYPLPTTACLLQSRLGLKTSVGALDFNLGCSGFVYGLSLADGLIRSGAARRVLLLTAETYSKYIHPTDRSLRTIFGDGAAATLIEAADEPTLSAFQFGTDGTGADTLLVTKGGARPAEAGDPPAASPALGKRPVHGRAEPDQLHRRRGAAAGREHPGRGQAHRVDEVDLYLLHQATLKMLDQLRERMESGQGAAADRPGTLRQHGLLDDSDPDRRRCAAMAA